MYPVDNSRQRVLFFDAASSCGDIAQIGSVGHPATG
jgi:hypothetical protein